MKKLKFFRMLKLFYLVKEGNNLLDNKLRPLEEDKQEKLLTSHQRNERNVISFSLLSNGRTGEEWLNYFKESGLIVSESAQDILLSLKATSNVHYQVVILKGAMFFTISPNEDNVIREAKLRSLKPCNLELACLIREKFSNEELLSMRLNELKVMHIPEAFVGMKWLLNICSCDNNKIDLDATPYYPDMCWHDSSSFVFIK